MSLSISPKVVSFTSNSSDGHVRSRRDKVEDAAAVTGATGAGVAATRNSANAFKYFRTSKNLRTGVNGFAGTTEAIADQAQKTKSLWHALKVNYQNLSADIGEWAKASKMPKFMKAILTGKFGSFLGGVAAVFVFVSGIREIFDTFVKNIDKLSVRITAPSSESFRDVA